jgi:hypothetical protein
MSELELYGETWLTQTNILKGSNGELIKPESGDFYQLISHDIVRKIGVNDNAPILASDFSKILSIRITKDDLYILESDFIELIHNLKMKVSSSKAKPTQRAENKQAEIIAALACMYTKTDCRKPYEAAETIRQEWERQADKLGNPPSTDTLSKYISRGMERLSR